MPNWLDDFFGDDWALGRTGSQCTSPSVNIIENDRCYCIEVAAPGLTREDFRVSLDERNELTVSVEKCSDSGKNEKNDKDDKPAKSEKHEKQTYLRREFSCGVFRRSFILPENVDKSKISATMKNGVLSLELPKKEESKQTPTVREIAIG